MSQPLLTIVYLSCVLIVGGVIVAHTHRPNRTSAEGIAILGTATAGVLALAGNTPGATAVAIAMGAAAALLGRLPGGPTQ